MKRTLLLLLLMAVLVMAYTTVALAAPGQGPEGEVDDPYIWHEPAPDEALPSGTYLMPDGSLVYIEGEPETAVDPDASPIWRQLRDLGPGWCYDFDNSEFVFLGEVHEGEADDPYIWHEPAPDETLPAGTYRMPDGSLLVIDYAVVPTVWW